jgi:hypothetical protein
MATRISLSTTLAACLLFSPAASAGPTLSPLDEVTEVLVHASGSDALFVDLAFGADLSNVINFNYTLSGTAHTFSYALLPGQTYLGQPIAVSLASTSYDPATSTYTWSETGQLGSQSWTGTGTIALIGDPTYSVTARFTLGGQAYTVNGTFNGSNGTSTDSLTVTGPSGPLAVSAPSTDSFGAGGWVYTVVIPTGTVKPGPTLVFNANAGTGHYVTSVPEPPSLLIAGTAGLMGLGWWRHRRRAAVH